MRIVPLLILPLFLVGCALPKEPSLDERIAVAMRPYEALAQQKADLWYIGQQPKDFEFPGKGTVKVRNWRLTGWPGEEYVTARITYENTTDHVVDTAFVWLEVLDSDDEVTGSSVVRLINPFGFSLWPGHTVTREIRAPTNGAHLDPDRWQWTVACETIQDTEPGDKPVLVTRRNPYARNFRYSGLAGYGSAGYGSAGYGAADNGPRFVTAVGASTYCPPSYPSGVPGRNVY